VALDLRECELSGKIPDVTSLTSMGKCGDCSVHYICFLPVVSLTPTLVCAGSFDIRKNTVSGTVPAELGLLTALSKYALL